MDDLGIHTQGDLALHHEHTQCILLRLREHGLSLKLSKCLFDTSKMEFLSTIIGQGQIMMDPVKLIAIRNWKPPASIKGIQSFLGFMNFYCKFIPNFFHVVALLNILTQKDQPWAWTLLQQRAFNTLQTAFSSGPVLGIPDVTWPFSIVTDASLFAAEAVLLQDDANGDSHPCVYFSKHSFLQNKIIIFTIVNSLLSSLHLKNRNSMFREPHILSPSSLTTRTSATSKIPINCLNAKLAGPSSSRTLTLSGRFSPVPRWPLLMPYLVMIPLTLPWTMPMPALSQNQLLSTP